MTRAWWRLLARLVCRLPPFSAMVSRREGGASRVCREREEWQGSSKGDLGSGSFDDRVGTGEQQRRNCETECLGSF